MDSIRRGLGSKSEAYKQYLRTLLRESAVNLPLAELQAAFEREYDPVMVEHLAAALVARTERGLEPEAMQAVAKRALEDRDPGLRAATVRALRRTGALERTGDMYERLVRDASPEVRKEAATNLVEDNLHVYGGRRRPGDGHRGGGARRPPRTQGDGEDPRQAHDGGDQRRVGAQARAAAAQRLRRGPRGGVHARSEACPRRRWPAPGSRCSACTATRQDPAVRKAIIQSIARLGFSGAVPELQRLRGVDPSLAPEIDTWIRVLNMNLQDWSLILREKQRLQQAR